MRNFKATIQVAEDGEFRKTVLDAIERVTIEQLNKQLPVIIGEELKKYFERHPGEIRSAIEKAVDKRLQNNDKLREITAEIYLRNKDRIESALGDDKIANIVAEAASNIVRSKLKM